MADPAQREDWKDKYRDLLAELEAARSDNAALDDTMRRVCSRLAIAAMGRDSAVDRHLEAIHRRIKRDGAKAEIARHLEELAQAVVAHDNQTAGLPPLDLGGFVARLPLPTQSQTKHVSALEHERLGVRQEGLAALADEISMLIAGSGVTAGHDDLMRFVDAMSEHDDLPPDLRAQLLTVGARLAALGEDASVAPILDDLSSAISATVASIGAEKKSLEAFIEQVTEQLTRFESWAGANQNDAKARAQDASELERNVDEHLEGFEADVSASSELSELQTRVQSRLDSIGDQIRMFREREQDRAQRARERQEALHEQVNRLKVRTNELARQCSDQEQRLMHDTLTGVHTRYAYDQRIQEEFQRWQRHGQPLSYSIWDIDFFKKVNDEFGHQVGDRLLAGVAGLLAQHTRSEDFVARIGGEEFVVLFPATNKETALGLSERLREALADAGFHFKGAPIAVTLSCGLTEFREGDTPEQVYERADKALYEAKRAGRNRCNTD